MKVSPLQSNFGGGEFSPLIYGRVDSDRYKTGLATCLNFIPTIQGGLTRRPGSKFVARTKDNGVATLQEFEFSTTQAYILEFGNTYIRFYKDHGLITETDKTITAATAANPVVITSASHGFSNGDRVYITGVSGMVELNNREFTVANVTANTFELSGINGTGFTAYTSGGTVAKIHEISSPYATAHLFELKFTQSADVLYIVHPSYKPRKLTRTGHTNWTLTEITFVDGPYLPTNTTSTTITPSATSGSVTLTASSALFASTDVGRLVRLNQGGTQGNATITAFGSSTSVTASVNSAFNNTSATSSWRLGVWSDTTGYPGTVAFHEDRLFFAGNTNTPQRLDGSRTGDYENFAPSDTSSTVTSSHAVSFSLNANDVNLIRWMTSDEKGMLVGTVGGEWAVSPSTQTEALSPTNINAKRVTSYGSANIQPVQAGKSTIYIQRAERKFRELAYFFDQDGFRATDLTVLSEHITAPGVVQIAYQKEPQSIIWVVRDDGELLGMTYDRDLDSLKVGWHRHQIGGASDAADSAAIVESVAVIPSPDGTRDELWILVKRHINGATVRYTEYLEKLFEDTDDQQDAVFVDSSITFDNPVTITNATAANPVVVTATSHGFSNGDAVIIRDVKGMTDLNGETFTVANVTANTFELSGTDGTGFSAYVSGGEVRKYVTTISGYNHLIGETVSILADGAVQPDVVVSAAGKITLSTRAATVQIGLGYNSDGELLRLEAGAADGTALGKTRRIHRIGLMLHRSLGLQIGMSFDELDTLTFRTSADPMTRAPSLFSGITSETLGADYDFENQFCFRQNQPLPSTILAVMPMLHTQDR